MNIDLRQLRAFVTVADLAQFTRAAERLSVSQSWLSTTIKNLEVGLGLRLFDRHTRMLRLTEAGAEILPAVKRLLADFDQVIGNSRDLTNLGRGRVAVAAPTVQAAIWLPGVIEEFSRRYPGVRVTLHDVPEQEVHNLVRSGTADIGVATAASDPASDLATQPFYADSYLAALHPGHPLASKRELVWRDLVALPVIGPLRGNPVRTHLDAALAREGYSLAYSQEVSLPWTMAGLVRAKIGVAVLTTAVRTMAEWMGLEIRAVQRPVIRRELVLVVCRDRALSPSAERFRKLMLLRKPG